MPTLYQRIRQRREELGMTQETLAEKMGYKSRSSINKIEIGKNDIPQSKILDFARALHTSPGYLLGLDSQQVETNGDGKETIQQNKTSYDEEAAAIAQQICDNPNLRLLYETIVDYSPEDLALITEMVKRMSGGNRK